VCVCVCVCECVCVCVCVCVCASVCVCVCQLVMGDTKDRPLPTLVDALWALPVAASMQLLAPFSAARAAPRAPAALPVAVAGLLVAVPVAATAAAAVLVLVARVAVAVAVAVPGEGVCGEPAMGVCARVCVCAMRESGSMHGLACETHGAAAWHPPLTGRASCLLDLGRACRG
jgi:hypothetical protein